MNAGGFRTVVSLIKLPLPIAAGDIELTGTAIDLVATRKIAAESSLALFRDNG